MTVGGAGVAKGVNNSFRTSALAAFPPSTIEGLDLNVSSCLSHQSGSFVRVVARVSDATVAPVRVGAGGGTTLLLLAVRVVLGITWIGRLNTRTRERQIYCQPLGALTATLPYLNMQRVKSRALRWFGLKRKDPDTRLSSLEKQLTKRTESSFHTVIPTAVEMVNPRARVFGPDLYSPKVRRLRLSLSVPMSIASKKRHTSRGQTPRLTCSGNDREALHGHECVYGTYQQGKEETDTFGYWIGVIRGAGGSRGARMSGSTVAAVTANSITYPKSKVETRKLAVERVSVSERDNGL
ncbi:hypothetical protein BKA62DRAFT_673807 [Auriculariales sp. MPI-PUGE-AT-0066]|nr:hypothetical protein BKA62DRAFT_673807 [Auriculariales sp. MPI-PUGE-AT-0066]